MILRQVDAFAVAYELLSRVDVGCAVDALHMGSHCILRYDEFFRNGGNVFATQEHFEDFRLSATELMPVLDDMRNGLRIDCLSRSAFPRKGLRKRRRLIVA